MIVQRQLTYEATAGANAVFTLTVKTDGSYNFTLQGPIDHASSSALQGPIDPAANSEELVLNFPITATDFDGDTSTVSIPVTIVDDKPTITGLTMLQTAMSWFSISQLRRPILMVIRQR
nr:VCBS domain-containing protein [Vibrio harveyi]